MGNILSNITNDNDIRLQIVYKIDNINTFKIIRKYLLWSNYLFDKYDIIIHAVDIKKCLIFTLFFLKSINKCNISFKESNIIIFIKNFLYNINITNMNYDYIKNIIKEIKIINNINLKSEIANYKAILINKLKNISCWSFNKKNILDIVEILNK